MITDEMLAKAAAEVSAAVTESVPEAAHRFSPEFEAKMDAVLHQKSQPAFGRGLRRAAAVALVILTAFGILTVASPTAWAAMTDWVKDTYKTYVVYLLVSSTSVIFTTTLSKRGFTVIWNSSSM